MKEAFIAHVFSNFQRYCAGKGLAPSTSSLLDYLLAGNLIPMASMHHYTILNEYKAWSAAGKYRNKTETIRALAKTYGLHENTVWNVLKDHEGKFG